MKKNINKILYYFIILFCVFNVYCQDELGGLAVEGTLRIKLYKTTGSNNIEVARYTSGSWVNQWYNANL